jgi:hypothetical protein
MENPLTKIGKIRSEKLNSPLTKLNSPLCKIKKSTR